jgi:hypothetical protein
VAKTAPGALLFAVMPSFGPAHLNTGFGGLSGYALIRIRKYRNQDFQFLISHIQNVFLFRI